LILAFSITSQQITQWYALVMHIISFIVCIFTLVESILFGKGAIVRRSDLIGLIMRRNELAHDIIRASMIQQLPPMLQVLLCAVCNSPLNFVQFFNYFLCVTLCRVQICAKVVATWILVPFITRWFLNFSVTRPWISPLMLVWWEIACEITY